MFCSQKSSTFFCTERKAQEIPIQKIYFDWRFSKQALGVITFIYGVLSGCRIEWIRELIPPTLMRHDGWLVRPNRDCPYPVCRQQCLSSGSPEGGHYIIRLKPHLSHGQWEDVLSINGWWMSFCCVKISVSFSIYNGKLKWKIIPACIHTQWSFFKLASPAR